MRLYGGWGCHLICPLVSSASAIGQCVPSHVCDWLLTWQVSPSVKMGNIAQLITRSNVCLQSSQMGWQMWSVYTISSPVIWFDTVSLIPLHRKLDIYMKGQGRFSYWQCYVITENCSGCWLLHQLTILIWVPMTDHVMRPQYCHIVMRPQYCHTVSQVILECSCTAQQARQPAQL